MAVVLFRTFAALNAEGVFESPHVMGGGEFFEAEKLLEGLAPGAGMEALHGQPQKAADPIG